MCLNGFSWLVKGSLAGMAHPGESPEAFAALVARGIGAVVGLTSRPLPEQLLKEQGLPYLHLPVPNFTPPLPTQIDRFIAFCEHNLQAGRPVVVHCLAGMGRTGTLLACYLVRQGVSPSNAIRRVRARRPGSIETPEQEKAVFEYAARGGPKRKRAGGSAAPG